jgi:hypothetical protein
MSSPNNPVSEWSVHPALATHTARAFYPYFAQAARCQKRVVRVILRPGGSHVSGEA